MIFLQGKNGLISEMSKHLEKADIFYTLAWFLALPIDQLVFPNFQIFWKISNILGEHVRLGYFDITIIRCEWICAFGDYEPGLPDLGCLPNFRQPLERSKEVQEILL